MKIYQSNLSYYVEEINGMDKPIKVPSQMYPLNGHNASIFHCDNTKPVTDEKIIKIFNETEYRVGRCYSNVEALYTRLKEAEIENVVPYSGWLFVADAIPVHHAFIVIDNEYVLDASTELKAEELIKQESKDLEDARKKLVDKIIENQNLPRSQVACCGKIDPLYIYIGSPCEPNKARSIYQKLMKIYPNHPSERNTDNIGMTKTQKMYYDKMK